VKNKMDLKKERLVIDSYLLSYCINKNGKVKCDFLSAGLGTIVMAEIDRLPGHADSIRIRCKDNAMKWYRKNNYKIPNYLLEKAENLTDYKNGLAVRALHTACRNVYNFHAVAHERRMKEFTQSSF
jgi:hypothetical protein